MNTRNATLVLAFAAAQAFVTIAPAQASYHMIPAHTPVSITYGFSGGPAQTTELLTINDLGEAAGSAVYNDLNVRYRWNMSTGHMPIPQVFGAIRVLTNQGDFGGTTYTDPYDFSSSLSGFTNINGVNTNLWNGENMSHGIYDYNSTSNTRVGVAVSSDSSGFLTERGIARIGNMDHLLPRPTGSPAGSWTHLFGVNSSGLMVGDAVFSDGKKSGLTWNGTNTIRLSVPNSTSSTARAINDSGAVVGSAVVSGVQRGYFYFPGFGFLYPGAIPGSATGSTVELLDINNGGVAVGTGQMSPTDSRAVVTVNAVTRDLNTMAQTGGWILERANAINNNGVIVGMARHQGSKKAFILVPNKTVRVGVTLNDFVGPSLVNTYVEVINQATGLPVNGAGANLVNGGEMALTAYPEQFRFRIRGRSSLLFTSPVYTKASVTENQLFNFNLTNGDVDGSGEVDAADIDEVIADFGQTSAWVLSDVDGSGEVDAADIDIAIANFGATNN